MYFPAIVIDLSAILFFISAFAPRHDKTNKMAVHPAKTQISLGGSAQSDQSLRCPHEETLGP